MAIQIPNPGTGNGATGDNEFVLWSKVKDNFSDQTNAASRLVGIEPNNLMQVGAFGWGALSIDELSESQAKDVINMRTGMYFYPVEKGQELHPEGVESAWGDRSCFILKRQSVNAGFCFWLPYHTGSKNNIYLQSFGGVAKITHKFYTDKNTTVDSNKNIKTSSPVVRVFSDHLDKIHEANDLPIKYARNGVGDYTIEGTTGLRENDWQIVIPEDDHRNQLIAFTMEDNNGTIRLKTYRRTFNMTTFMFEPDLSTPLDIPEGRWVDLHFNDLPQEQLDEPIE